MTDRKVRVTAKTDRPVWLTLLAFAIIYFVWGSTFLAIRIGVHEVPPLIFAGLRFLPAGAVLTAWMMLRGERLPTARQWGSGCLLALLMFVVDYGLLFWAEQRVPSGVAAVMMATIPAFIALAEIVLLRTRRLTLRLGIALLVGIAGVAVLVSHSVSLGAAALDWRGALALLVGALAWSVASVLSRRLPLPESRGMSSGTQMLLVPADACQHRVSCRRQRGEIGDRGAGDESGGGLARRLGGAGVSGCGWLDHWVYGVCLAALS